MALIVKDRIKETTATTGTGTVTLAGASTGFQAFSVVGNANTTYYAIVSGNNWEVGLGTYTLSGTTLSRDTVLESSNSGSKITLAGTSDVFCTYPAEKAVTLNGTVINDADVVATANIVDDAVTVDKLANSINTEITANTAKTGITSGQASAITANTAKVTNATHTGDVTGATSLTIANDAVITAKILDSNVTDAKIAAMTSSKLTGALPAISGASLTSIPAGNLTGTVADARITTLTSSKLTGALPAIDGSALTGLGGGGKILQVLQVFKADTFSTTSSSLVDVTGLSIAITPSATTSKILVIVNTNGLATDNSAQTLVRDSTVIGGGTVTSSRTSSYGGSMYNGLIGQPGQFPYNVTYLDSPSTTSAVTYKVQLGAVGGGTAYLGRDTTDNDNAQHARTGQQITVMEVGA
jgi:hypothetical protein